MIYNCTVFKILQFISFHIVTHKSILIPTCNDVAAYSYIKVCDNLKSENNNSVSINA